MKKTQLLGIQRYYYRLLQNQYGNTYYVTPRDNCPLKVLNDRQRFVVVTFDADDDYLVVNNRRYYLTNKVAIKGTANLHQRVAVVDLVELAKAKSYPFKSKFTRKYTFKADSLRQLQALAAQQFATNGAPYFKQKALYNEKTGTCRYIYETSFD